MSINPRIYVLSKYFLCLMLSLPSVQLLKKNWVNIKRAKVFITTWVIICICLWNIFIVTLVKWININSLWSVVLLIFQTFWLFFYKLPKTKSFIFGTNCGIFPESPWKTLKNLFSQKKNVKLLRLIWYVKLHENKKWC